MSRPARTLLLAACMAFLACLLPATSLAQTSGGAGQPSSTGGTSYLPPAGKAKLMNGIAIPPADAPPQVISAITAANQIVRKPYVYGGGHGNFVDKGYDCSGSVSYALHGGGLLTQPLDSSDFMKWGLAGRGRWITVYTNPGHAFMVIAGLRFDTGYRDRTALHGAAPGTGPRWGHQRPTKGFSARHPLGF